MKLCSVTLQRTGGMRQNPADLTSTTVYITTRWAQIPNYHIIARSNRSNQIPRDRGTLCESKRDDRIGGLFMLKYEN